MSSPSSNRILIVAYHFPPDSSVGALRPLKFVKYLPYYGWEPYVLTVKPGYYAGVDRSRLAEIPSLERVFRTSVLPHPNTVYKSLKQSYVAVTGRKPKPSHSLSRSRSEETGNAHRTLDGARRFLSSLLWIPPDDALGWLPIAVVKGARLIKKHRITHIYTTNPPHTAHLVGWALRATCQVKWIADFRDLWLFDKPFQTRTAERIERWMEQRVVERADGIVLTTDWMAEKFRLTYRSVDPGKFTTISNGYDAEDFRSLVARPDATRFTVTYLGSFYDERTPEPLLVAASRLIADGSIPADGLQIQLIGNCRYVKDRPTADIAASLGLSSIVRVIDAVPYKRALEYAMSAHLLVLLAPDQPYEIPAKAYEYLAAGVEILALTQEGATADLIRKADGGLVVDPHDTGQIREALLECYLRWTASRDRTRRPKDTTMFERRELTKRLASILGSDA